MINGLGNENANKIVQARNNKQFESFIDCLINLAKNGITKSLFDKLVNVGVFDQFKLELSKKAMSALVKSYFDQNVGFKNDDDLISYEEKKALVQSSLFFLTKEQPELFLNLSKDELIAENELADSLLKVSFEAIKKKVYKPNIFKKEIAFLEKQIKDLKTVKQLKGALQKEVCSILVQIKKVELKNKI